MKKYSFVIAIKPDLCESVEDVTRITSSLRRYFCHLKKILPDPEFQYSFVREYENGRLKFYGVLMSDKIDHVLFFVSTATLHKQYQLYGLSDRFGINRFWEL